MFSLQTSSDEMLRLALLSHSGGCCPHSAQPPSCPWPALWKCAGDTHGRACQGCKAADPGTGWQQTAFQGWVFAQRNPGTQLIGDHLVPGSLSQFSCLCKTLFGCSPFSI